MDLNSRFAILVLFLASCVIVSLGEEQSDSSINNDDWDEFNVFVQTFLAHLLNSDVFTKSEKEDLKAIVFTVETVITAPRRRESDIVRKMQLFNVAVVSAIAETIGADGGGNSANTKKKANAIARALTSAFNTVSSDSSSNEQLISEVNSMVNMFARLEHKEGLNLYTSTLPSVFKEPGSTDLNTELLPRKSEETVLPEEKEENIPTNDFSYENPQIMNAKPPNTLETPVAGEYIEELNKNIPPISAVTGNEALSEGQPAILFSTEGPEVKTSEETVSRSPDSAESTDWNFVFCLYNELFSTREFSEVFSNALPYHLAQTHIQRISSGLAKTLFQARLSEYDIFSSLNTALLYLSPTPTTEEFAFMFGHALSKMLYNQGMFLQYDSCALSKSIASVIIENIRNPSSEVPADTLSSEVPADNLSSEAPADNPSSEVPAENPSSEVPAETPSSEVPAENPSSEVPADNPSVENPLAYNKPPLFNSTITSPNNNADAKQQTGFQPKLLNRLLSSEIFHAAFPQEITNAKLRDYAYAVGSFIPAIPEYKTLNHSVLTAAISETLQAVRSLASIDKYAGALATVISKSMESKNLLDANKLDKQVARVGTMVLNALSTQIPAGTKTTARKLPEKREKSIQIHPDMKKEQLNRTSVAERSDGSPLTKKNTSDSPPDVKTESIAAKNTPRLTNNTKSLPSVEKNESTIAISSPNISPRLTLTNTNASPDIKIDESTAAKHSPNISPGLTNTNSLSYINMNESTAAKNSSKPSPRLTTNTNSVPDVKPNESTDVTNSPRHSPELTIKSDNSQLDALTTEATSTEETSTEAASTEAASTEATSTEATSTEVTSTEATSTEATSTEATSTEATSTEATSTEATSTEATSTEAISTEATSTEATSTEATPTEKTSTVSTSTESTSTEATLPLLTLDEFYDSISGATETDKPDQVLNSRTDSDFSVTESQNVDLTESSNNTTITTTEISTTTDIDQSSEEMRTTAEPGTTTGVTDSSMDPNAWDEVTTSDDFSTPFSGSEGLFELATAITDEKESAIKQLEEEIHRAEQSGTTEALVRALAAVVTEGYSNQTSETTGVELTETTNSSSRNTDGVYGGLTYNPFTGTETTTESFNATKIDNSSIQTSSDTSTVPSTAVGSSLSNSSFEVSTYSTIVNTPKSENNINKMSNKAPRSTERRKKIPRDVSSNPLIEQNPTKKNTTQLVKSPAWLFECALSYSLLSSEKFADSFKPETSPSDAKSLAFTMAEAAAIVPPFNFTDSVFVVGHAYYTKVQQMPPNSTAGDYSKAFANATSEIALERDLLTRENQIPLAIVVGNAIHDSLSDEQPRSFKSYLNKGTKPIMPKPFELGEDASTSAFLEELLSTISNGDTETKQELLSQTLSDIGAVLGNKHLKPKTILIKLLMEALVAAVNVIISDSSE